MHNFTKYNPAGHTVTRIYAEDRAILEQMAATRKKSSVPKVIHEAVEILRKLEAGEIMIIPFTGRGNEIGDADLEVKGR